MENEMKQDDVVLEKQEMRLFLWHTIPPHDGRIGIESHIACRQCREPYPGKAGVFMMWRMLPSKGMPTLDCRVCFQSLDGYPLYHELPEVPNEPREATNAEYAALKFTS